MVSAGLGSSGGSREDPACLFQLLVAQASLALGLCHSGICFHLCGHPLCVLSYKDICQEVGPKYTTQGDLFLRSDSISKDPFFQ